MMPIHALEWLGLSPTALNPSFIAVGLQGDLWANQQLPRVTTHWGVAVFPISDKGVERVGLLVDDNESELIVDPHTEADLGEGYSPVGC